MIILQDVSMTLNNNLILDNISLLINKNDSVGIMGPSGAGKTTLLSLLAKLKNPTVGEVIFDNALKTSFVFQTPNLLLNKNVLNNLLLPVKKTNENIAYAIELLSMVGLSGYEKYFPSMLSGGEQQRLSIARALMTKPNILFLDEPTSALDQEVLIDILNLIKKIKEELNITLITITHNPSVAKYLCNKVLWLSHGKVKRFDTIKPISSLISLDNLISEVFD